MKVLAIDDQRLILLSLEKKLTALGYDVFTANSVEAGIMKYNEVTPDLVLLDMNLPEIEGLDVAKGTGIEVVKYVRHFINRDTPIIVMTGNNNEDLVTRCIGFGVSGYLKKPVSLEKVARRVRQMLGIPKSGLQNNEDDFGQIVRKNSVGIVIPCYNIENILMSDRFNNFIRNNVGYQVCFVNRGSTDNTLQLLYDLKQDHESNLIICNATKNEEKAEVVRKGVHYVMKYGQFDYIGLLDIESSENYDDFNELVKIIENSKLKVISGNPLNEKTGYFTLKSFISELKEQGLIFVQKTMGVRTERLQCRAVLMDKDIVKRVFMNKFITGKLHNLEIFMRSKSCYLPTNKSSSLTCLYNRFKLING